MAKPTHSRRRAASRRDTEEEEEAPSGLFHQGEDILRGAKKAQQEAKQGKQPLRFWLKGGDECEIIILDEKLEKGIAFYEHNQKGPDGKWGNYSVCRKEVGRCPHCETGDKSYYILYLTVLVLKSFTTKSGIEVPQSRMLLGIKGGQIEEFKQLQDSAEEEGDSLRGMYLLMKRSNDSKASRIGKPSVLKGGRLYDIYSEDELVNEFGHDKVLGDDNKTVIKEEDADITPYEYKKIFKSPKQLEEEEEADTPRRRRPRAGSQEEAEREFEQEEEEEEEEARPRRRAATQALARATARRSAARATERSGRRRAARSTHDEDPLED